MRRSAVRRTLLSRAPGFRLSRSNEDIALLAKYTDCVRTYSVDDGLDYVLQSARRHGLKVLHGVWVSGDPEKTRRQVATSVAYAKAYPDVIKAMVVGNEVLLRGEMTAADLIAVIRDIKARCRCR